MTISKAGIVGTFMTQVGRLFILCDGGSRSCQDDSKQGLSLFEPH